MKVRKALAIACYTLCIAGFGVCGYVSLLSYRKDISYKLGFLIFLPVWITTYWFSTFFMQLICKKGTDGKNQWLIGKKARKIMNAVVTALSFILMAFWIYVYFFLVMTSK